MILHWVEPRVESVNECASVAELFLLGSSTVEPAPTGHFTIGKAKNTYWH
ncbi:unnamed protein product [Penicillium roqueforti FM164]|uniref:Uncharacterized protein n=1 Tax=Penicillium roqueforti (strain FM164) TaxID=1365484 RepID=W6QJ60_PENRF|nr:unnamed protein product [Penicillium roqueforti FM164]